MNRRRKSGALTEAITTRTLRFIFGFLILLITIGPIVWKTGRGKTSLTLWLSWPPLLILLIGVIKRRLDIALPIGIALSLAFFVGMGSSATWPYASNHRSLATVISLFIYSVGFGVVGSSILRERKRWSTAGIFALAGIVLGIGVIVVASNRNYSLFVSKLTLPLMITFVLGNALALPLGMYTGVWLEPRIKSLGRLWPYLRVMSIPLAGFGLVYLAIILLFGTYYWATFTCDGDGAICSIKGFSANASIGDFFYFSVTTIATLGYGDAVPASPLARFLSSLEAIVGIGWITVGFAGVLAYLQPRFAELSKRNRP